MTVYSCSIPLEVLIRPATQVDNSEVLAVVRDAFSGGDGGGREEIEIVEAIWSRNGTVPGCDLVAIAGGEIVGHVLASLGRLNEVEIPGIAPLAVRSDRQRQGVGSELVAEAVRQLKAQRFPIVVLLGDPNYYERFGFGPSGPSGIHYLPVGMNNPHFQFLQLNEERGALTGEYVYNWELDTNSHP